MAGGPPTLSIEAEGYLGFVKQAAFGTPDTVPSNTRNWIEYVSRDLSYDAGWHAIKTGAGTRASERKAGRGTSKTQNGWTNLLQPTAGAALLCRFFGTDTWTASQASEVQTITQAATGGTFTLTFNGQTTPAQAYNVATATLQTALRALSTIGSGNINVTGTAGTSYVLTFAGTLANAAQPFVQLDTGGLTGGTASIARTTRGTPNNGHVFTPSQPQLLTLVKIMAGQGLQYRDCLLDTLDLQQSGAEWTAKWGVAGGIGDTQVDTSSANVPNMPTDPSVFEWGDTTLSSAFGGLAEGEVSGLTLRFMNNIRQFPGGGSYAPTKARGGAFQSSGQCTFLYDSAAAAQAQADYISGVETTLIATLTKDSTHKIVFELPQCHVTADVPQGGLDDLAQLQCSWFVREPENVIVTLVNDDLLSYT